jgi:hypothetical protein
MFERLRAPAVAAARRLGTRSVGSGTLPPSVMTPLGLGWGQRTKSVTEELHPMPSWHFRATAVGLKIVAWLGSSSCVSLQLQLYPTATERSFPD